MMRYLSVCSGIEAATQAWHPLGWQPVAFSEIEPFPCAVLKHHYPDVPNWGDMTKFQEWPDAAVDVLCGGTPCQSFSVAGLRQGLADPRGNLMLTFGAIAGRYRPKWLVWENVPGVLSSNGGRDFGAFLGMLGELGYGVAYRVLDAQHVRTRRFPFAVPQRRRRVFVVGYLGDWRRAAAVLFDRESLSGHPAPRRKAGQGSSARAALSLAIRGREGVPSVEVGENVANAILTPNGGRAGVGVGAALIQSNSGDVGYCLTASAQQSLDAETETLIAVAHALRGEGFDASEDGTGRGTPLVPVAIQERAVSENVDAGPQGAGFRQDGAAYTLEARHHVQAVAFSAKDHGADASEGVSPTLRAGGFTGSTLAKNSDMHVAMEVRNADAYEADASSALSTLRKAVGKEAYAQWALAILAAFQSPEVLQLWLHGGSLQGATEEVRTRMDDGALSRPQHSGGRVLLNLWVHGPDGRSSQGRGLAKQLAGQPGAPLSVLPPEATSDAGEMLHLRSAREGARLLREALSAIQEVGRSDDDQGQPAHAPWAVRRLTPREAERLMAFPDDFTLIPWRKGMAPDSPRYKALGNSWAVNCAEWIGERIAEVDTWSDR